MGNSDMKREDNGQKQSDQCTSGHGCLLILVLKASVPEIQ